MSATYTRPYLYPKQHEAFFSPERYVCTEATTKAGKTVGAIAWIIEKALAGEPNQNYWWVAPIFDQAMIAYTRIKNGLTPGSFQALASPSPRIIMPNRTIIWVKSGDNPDSLYGEDVFAAVGDEASRIKEESWYALRSTLTATQGPVRLIGNVKGRRNWFYRLARLAEKEGSAINMRYVKITVLDAIAAGVIPQSEVEDARRTLPERVFRELYMAEPSDDGGNPFGLSHIEACVGALSSKKPVAFGIDLAKKHDYLVVIGLDEDGAVCVFERWQGVPWPESIARIYRLVGEDVPALVDSTGIGDPVIDQLQYDHGNFKGFHFSNVSKQRLMEGLAVAIQSREVRYPEGPIRIELDSFEYRTTPTHTFYSAPEGEESFDDCVCALALARSQWTQAAPAKNLMDFYAASAQKAKTEAREQAVRELDLEDLGLSAPTKSEVLTNELTDLYNQTLAGYAPDAITCRGCGEPILGPSRVSDGAYVWHDACAGLTLGRAA